MIVSTVEMTMAVLGRLMKTEESISSFLRLAGEDGFDDNAGPHALQPLDDHHLALLHSVNDDIRRLVLPSERDIPLLDPLVGGDNQHENLHEKKRREWKGQ